jgi:hypothetical protein
LNKAIGILLVLATWPAVACHAETVNILRVAGATKPLDLSGATDVSPYLITAVTEANRITAAGKPACIYLPSGVYRIVRPPPQFVRAGCVRGDGSTQTIIILDPSFAGDLFSWSEAWANTTPGPTAIGFKIVGASGAKAQQNALVFYDRNDEVFLDDIEVDDLPGRALYSGVTQRTTQAYMRESHIRSLRFFGDGVPGVPVVEFNSQGSGATDATNEIRMSQVDIYGAKGPSFVIRNNGSGVVRSITAESLRIEGPQDGSTAADLLTIGDPVMRGTVEGITFGALELIDPPKGYAALRLTAAPGAAAPYQITVRGAIGGGLAHGEGIRIDAGRSSTFQLSIMHTEGVNVVVGPGASQLMFDGGGREACWTFRIDPRSRAGVSFPVWATSEPAAPEASRSQARPGGC